MVNVFVKEVDDYSLELIKPKSEYALNPRPRLKTFALTSLHVSYDQNFEK